MRTDREALETWQYLDIQLYARARADVLTRLKWWLFGMPSREDLEDRLASNEFTRGEEAEIRELIAEELGEGDEDSGADVLLEEIQR